MNIFMLPNLSEILEDLLRPNVMKGAAWLDEYEPKWVSKIVPDQLDISSSSYCICGQVFGDYRRRPEMVSESPELFGFTAPDHWEGFLGDLDEGAQYAFWQWASMCNRMWRALD